jgi:hypothetical protein
VPVRGATGRECPFNGLRSDAGLNIWVFINVVGVVVINKIIGADLVKDHCSNEHQGQANPKAAVFG